jgi:dTDP-4-dehydrorhamnose 3,5-epimerase-like enzyme
MKQPQIITGGTATDNRGSILFNNDLNLVDVKRMYTVQNKTKSFVRGWQGHKIQQRWFTAIDGCFEINLIDYNKFEMGITTHYKFELSSEVSSTLHIPAGYMTTIQATTNTNKLLVFSDFLLNEIDDEYRFELGHFSIFLS